MPLRDVLVGACCWTSAVSPECINSQVEQARMLVCLLYLDGVQLCVTESAGVDTAVHHWLLTASKSILLWCTGMIRDLYTASLAHGVVVEIDVGALVEAMMWGVLSWRGKVVVDICEAKVVSVVTRRGTVRSYSVNSDTSPCCGGIVVV